MKVSPSSLTLNITLGKRKPLSYMFAPVMIEWLNNVKLKTHSNKYGVFNMFL